jgi:hypothetical protein
MAKRKEYMLIKPIPAVFSRDDESNATFQGEDIGLIYSDADQAVARAVDVFPECFRAV